MCKNYVDTLAKNETLDLSFKNTSLVDIPDTTWPTMPVKSGKPEERIMGNVMGMILRFGIGAILLVVLIVSLL